MPGLLDHRLVLEPLDQDAAFLVHRKIHRAHHPLATAFAEPGAGGIEQRAQHGFVVLELEEPEHPAAGSVVGVESVVDLGADPPHYATSVTREEVLRAPMLEVGVELAA